jgi:hypothetical protein
MIFKVDAFGSEQALHEYCRANGASLHFAGDIEELTDIFITAELIELVVSLLREMLHVEASERPAARQILKALQVALS